MVWRLHDLKMTVCEYVQLSFVFTSAAFPMFTLYLLLLSCFHHLLSFYPLSCRMRCRLLPFQFYFSCDHSNSTMNLISYRVYSAKPKLDTAICSILLSTIQHHTTLHHNPPQHITRNSYTPLCNSYQHCIAAKHNTPVAQYLKESVI